MYSPILIQICHGDIKTENVLVTNFNWVCLADFAPFKPAYLPDDNPADFTFYFDTSARRCCYLSPERFRSSGDSLFSTAKEMKLAPEMDIFSVGCTIAELFLEGQPLFTLSQLLLYRVGEYDPSSTLEKIEDVQMRLMITSMISVDPASRLSAQEVAKA
jgi:phosphoinositide-3-kinase, regulatory subunit 4